MGMYTELNIGVSLRSDTPYNIVNILRYMLGETDEKNRTDHPLFSTERWSIMLRCDSAYFDGLSIRKMKRDNIDREYKLTVRTNFKNYDNEIELFLDFIRPYLTTVGFMGYERYEECDDPTLIYNNIYENKIEYKRISV